MPSNIHYDQSTFVIVGHSNILSSSTIKKIDPNASVISQKNGFIICATDEIKMLEIVLELHKRQQIVDEIGPTVPPPTPVDHCSWAKQTQDCCPQFSVPPCYFSDPLANPYDDCPMYKDYCNNNMKYATKEPAPLNPNRLPTRDSSLIAQLDIDPKSELRKYIEEEEEKEQSIPKRYSSILTGENDQAELKNFVDTVVRKSEKRDPEQCITKTTGTDGDDAAVEFSSPYTPVPTFPNDFGKNYKGSDDTDDQLREGIIERRTRKKYSGDEALLKKYLEQQNEETQYNDFLSSYKYNEWSEPFLNNYDHV
jgi:hypothetical protein